jgi:hypothetical protein
MSRSWKFKLSKHKSKKLTPVLIKVLMHHTTILDFYLNHYLYVNIDCALGLEELLGTVVALRLSSRLSFSITLLIIGLVIVRC